MFLALRFLAEQDITLVVTTMLSESILKPLSLNVETIVPFSRLFNFAMIGWSWASLTLHGRPVIEDTIFWVLIKTAGNVGAEEIDGFIEERKCTLLVFVGNTFFKQIRMQYLRCLKDSMKVENLAR